MIAALTCHDNQGNATICSILVNHEMIRILPGEQFTLVVQVISDYCTIKTIYGHLTGAFGNVFGSLARKQNALPPPSKAPVSVILSLSLSPPPYPSHTINRAA